MGHRLAAAVTALTLCSYFGVPYAVPLEASVTEKQEADGRNGSSVCLTEEAFRGVFINSTGTLKECYTSLGFNVSANFPQRDPGDTAQRDRNNLCLLGCFWENQGLIKDGSFIALEFAKSSILPDSRTAFVSTFQKCLDDSNVTASYKEDGCMNMKHVKCISKAIKACEGENPDEE